MTRIDNVLSKEDVIAFIRSHTDQPQATSSNDYTPFEVPSGMRTFSFDVDTSTFKLDEYIVVVSGVKEVATGTVLFNVLEPGATPIKPQSTPTPTQPLPLHIKTTPGITKEVFIIRINQIGDKRVGDTFTITGYTNLPADAELFVQVYSSSFKPTQKSQSGEFSGATNTIRVVSPPSPAVNAMPALLSTMAPGVTRVPGTAAPTPVPTGAVADRQYSKTNVQVKEVDEGDIVKTDGTNIYVVTRNCLHIVKAYPAKSAEILSTLRFAGTPQALYVQDNQVVLVATDFFTRPVAVCKPGACYGNSGSTPRTLIYVFSVADPANPVQVRELAIDGTYTSSRMIGSQLYFVTSTAIPYQLDDLELPLIHDDHGGISTPPVYGFNTTDQAFAFSTIGSLDIAGTTPVPAKSFLVGTAGTMYVSPTHLYIAVPDPYPYRAAPSTTIHSFAIDNGKFSYAAGGKVDGTLLNQYSLDEYNGNLRVATTIASGSWQAATSQYSKITILDRNLAVMGTLPGIAPGERIYAARFMGDRLYLVTFRRTDPFYVIGLVDPKHPVILGELKLPGFSNYLHPYDAYHIIGIGKESQSGPVKMALFDVSDVKNPALLDSETLGGSYSTSPVLDDPKAFLFDKEKDLLVLPLHLMVGEYRCSPKGECTQPTVWGGVYVYGVNPKTGFVLKGTVTHYDNYYGPQNPVKRSLYIDQTLYTMSEGKIVMSDLAHSLNRLNEVDFQ